MFKTFTALIVSTALLAFEVEAGNCPTKKNKDWCKSPAQKLKSGHSDGKTDCECECKWSTSNNECTAEQDFYKNSKLKYDESGKEKSSGKAKKTECGCKDKPAPACEVTADTCAADNADATAVAADYMVTDCACAPAMPEKQCDPMYNGLWKMDAAGADCPASDMGAMNMLASAALAIGTVLLF